MGAKDFLDRSWGPVATGTPDVRSPTAMPSIYASPRSQAIGRRYRANARSVHLIPGPMRCPGGLRGHRRRRRTRGDLRRHGPLARSAPREPPVDGTHADAGAAMPGGREVLRRRIDVPRSGRYWYHPHIREDYGQEMGLYGNVARRARPTRTTGRRSHRELVLTLDDVLIEDGKIAPFSRSETTLRGDGPLRQRAAGRRRAGSRR